MKNIALIIFLVCTSPLWAQHSHLWEEYKEAQREGTEHKLPNFSYAGYKYSEVPLPDVNFKVFDVTEFGASPNGQISSKNAIRKAIAAAEKNGNGIIFFPKGKYLINAEGDDLSPIKIASSNIVFRGEGNTEEGSILFFEKDLPPADPDKLYSVPKMIIAKAETGDKKISEVVSDAKRETFTVEVEDASGIQARDWIILKVQSTDKELLEYDLQPIEAQPEWKTILNKGVLVNERHQVKTIEGNKIIFYDPIHYDIQAKHGWEVLSFGHLENVGFENILFEGNWNLPFKHHKNAQHDGGWGILQIGRSVNSWVKDCHFKNVSVAATFSQSAFCTALNNVISGNYGHNAISAAGGSSGILIARTDDQAGQWHTCGVGGGSTTGTVIWRCKHPEHSCFESHASQPRCTLFDNIEGGFFLGRAGGARQNLPNHGRYLVLWNYKETDEAEEDFEFWSTKTWFWKMVPPIIVGFHGAGTTFLEKDVDVVESPGIPVDPESLWEAQLELRLGKLPEWINQYN